MRRSRETVGSSPHQKEERDPFLPSREAAKRTAGSSPCAAGARSGRRSGAGCSCGRSRGRAEQAWRGRCARSERCSLCIVTICQSCRTLHFVGKQSEHSRTQPASSDRARTVKALGDRRVGLGEAVMLLSGAEQTL